ncbi:MAG: CHAT domain-containing protein [Gracilimonas sp.]|uniref:CHAT domain-containing protein n=1 Tax=Gracilimonas sp. TaxID=1974203 RepID=UPI0019B6DFD6|nr:CHAT domain-containing protein [Gracilimonas sp.]MBD3616475.1 CHAT domain-containing protein [Gracilimonas sp.]
MNLLYLLIIAFTFSDTTDVRIQTENQIEHYVNNIKSDKNLSLNSWAFHEVATLNCTTLDIAKKHLQNLPDHASYYEYLDCNDILNKKAGDESIQFWEGDILDRYKRIIESESKITEEILGFNDYPLLHFTLLMRSNASDYYSLEYLKQALENWLDYSQSLTDKNNLEYVLFISNIIRAAYILDKYEIIEKHYEIFVNQNILPNSSHKLRLLGAFDYTFYVLGNYDRSLKLQREESLPLAQFIGKKSDVQAIKNRQGAYLFSLGKYEESKIVYEELYNDSLSFENQYSLFTNLGVNYLKLGQANKYISFQLRALNQETKNYRSLLQIYRNLFVYYVSIKDVNVALSYIDKAKEVAQNNSDTTELALIDSYLGSFYWSTYKDHEKALDFLNSAEGILSPERDYARYANLLIERGTILIEIDSLDAAQNIFNTIKKLTLSKSDTPKYIDALVNLSSIYLKKGDLKNTFSNLEEIKLYSLDNIDFPLLTKYYTVKAEYNYKTGNRRAAIAELKPVVDQVIDRAKNNTDSQEGYWSVEDEYLEAFALMVELFIETEAPEEALLLLDQLKTINDASLYNSPLIKAAKLSEEDLVEEKRLNRRLQSLRKKYLNATQEERFAIKIEIDRTSAMREQILAEVNLNKERDLPSVWAVQRSIQSNELVLHFTEVGTHLYVTHLTRDDTKINVYDFPQETQEKFSSIADDLASGNTNLNHLHELYRFLDLSQIPDDINMISVIPDNYLYRIPLEILPTESPDSPISFGSTHYLIEDYSFRYFTSLKEFDGNQRTFNASTENDFSGFGISDFKNFKNTNLPSLPYATVETRNINSVLTSFQQKEIYNEGNATKDAFKRQVGSSRLVHVATHSEVSEQNPLFSTIYLKNSNPGDTLESEQALYAYELFDTPLNSEFIMLNSCSSGSGNYIQGSGVMGISRALRYAGAKSLALNLWSVNDKVASEFATDFYGYLNEGVTKSEAIRKAKLNQLKRSNANPHFWGAYMMIGNPSPITRSSENAFLLFSLLAASILFSGYTTYQKAAA